MDYSQMTGRELIIASKEFCNDADFQAAFMSAIITGKFQGMTPGIVRRIKGECA